MMKRLDQHREAGPDTFVGRYHATRLVYFEVFQDVRAAIAREKEIKGWSRMKKEELVRSANPEWKDLSAGWENRSSEGGCRILRTIPTSSRAYACSVLSLSARWRSEFPPLRLRSGSGFPQRAQTPAIRVNFAPITRRSG
ncbi:MAG: Excinuclease subunit domain protein [Candidatus Angelobacter sp.]|jgi:putative endonuclease|nr:Excinuclease subunit domain protein [Candidatus Angelobacter sp.]